MHGVTDQTERGRFELVEEGKVAFASYRREGSLLVIPHVEADPALRGRGTAGRLMAGMLDLVRWRREKVRPLCGYAAAWIRRHPEYHDLVG